jgi:ATP-dependent DNA helicase RecQ
LGNLEQTRGWTSWEQKLEAALKKKGNSLSRESFLARIAFKLNSERNKSETDKALFRLASIGVIDDYTTDFNQQVYKVYGKKKTEKDYLQHLRYHLGKYFSTVRVNRIIEGLDARPGNTLIQRMLNYLIEFIYQEIAKKREQGIKTMQEFCAEGLVKGNIEMKAWIHLYFNSKYARKNYELELDEETVQSYRVLRQWEVKDQPGLYNLSLLDWTDEGKRAEIDFVFDFIQIVKDDYNGTQIDNLKHLRGACTRLLIVNPDNYVFYLLRAFSALILSERISKKQRRSEQVIDDLAAGWIKYREMEQQEEEIWNVIQAFRAAVENDLSTENVSYQAWVSSVFEASLFLYHAKWTNQFEQKLTSELNLVFTNE